MYLETEQSDLSKTHVRELEPNCVSSSTLEKDVSSQTALGIVCPTPVVDSRSRTGLKKDCHPTLALICQ